MAIGAWFFPAAFLFVSAATAFDPRPDPANSGVSIVQPGAPGQGNKSLSPATAGAPARAPAEADISFMQGMIMHHAQAVEMTDLLRTRGRSKKLQALGLRIS